MSNTAAVTQIEQKFNAEQILLSTTDLQGNITYANQAFVEISGFALEELLGQPHNIVRHPDMPAAAFKTLWQQIGSGQPWMGIVKNRTKTGDHYWVNAYVLPVVENGQIIEYQSVRSLATRDQIAQAEKVYSEVQQKRQPRTLKPPKMTFCGKVRSMAMLSTLITALIATYQPGFAALFGAAMAGFSVSILHRPIKKLAQKSRNIVDDPISRAVYAGRQDELGDLDLALNYLSTETGGVIGRMADSSQVICQQSVELRHAMDDSALKIADQSEQLQQATLAMEQMNSRFSDVNENTQRAADEMTMSHQAAEKGHQQLNKVIASIQSLSEEVGHFSHVVSSLEQDSHNITGVLEEIRSIAEQTNLLALNAAIEAARAGESGRGFAVVADEVRQLSSRTSESTTQIEQILDKFQLSTHKAVQAMSSGQAQAGMSVTMAQQAGEEFEHLRTAMERVAAMSEVNAQAMDQQSQVAEEINQNLNRINQLAQQIQQQVSYVQDKAAVVSEGSSKTDKLSKQFWQHSIYLFQKNTASKPDEFVV